MWFEFHGESRDLSGWSRQLGQGGGGDSLSGDCDILTPSLLENTAHRQVLSALGWAPHPVEDPKFREQALCPRVRGSWGSNQGRWEVRGQGNIYPAPRGLHFYEAGKRFKAATSPPATCPCSPALRGKPGSFPSPSSPPELSTLSPSKGGAPCPASSSERDKDLPGVAEQFQGLASPGMRSPAWISPVYSE